MSRYQIRPIADETCTSLNPADETLATAASEAEAKALAATLSAGHCYGVGILDTRTGQIDVGCGVTDATAERTTEEEAPKS